MVKKRHDGRKCDQIREVVLKRHYTKNAAGSVLVTAGGTVVLVTASVENGVPPFLRGQGKGWITAEYGMLPGSTSPRKPRDRAGKVDGRTVEIQRLIGRSLRQAVDLHAIGEITITLDCDVLQADGGTRTASITGAFVALVDALAAQHKVRPLPGNPIVQSIVAVSAGIVDGVGVLDLDYVEDSTAIVDMNIVMTGEGRYVEVQGTGEGSPFDHEQLQELLALGRKGAQSLTAIQKKALGRAWPIR